jgi:hypothetical protein
MRDWEVWLDHRESGINPDGAVVDADGRFWCAEWGGSRVACYAPSGDLVEEIPLDVPQPTCPAFGGPDLSTLHVTSARQGMPSDAMDGAPRSGMTLSVATSARRARSAPATTPSTGPKTSGPRTPAAWPKPASHGCASANSPGPARAHAGPPTGTGSTAPSPRSQAGLKIVLGTPTATPPRWMLDRIPTCWPMTPRGAPRGFGSRRHYCFSHEGYREECRRIAEAPRRPLWKAPARRAWQIDNEYGCHDTTLSYSAAARAAFRDWLAQRYQSIDALNRAWGNVFWSMEYEASTRSTCPT